MNAEETTAAAMPLYHVFTKTPMQVDCSWCSTTITPGRAPVSHGICAPCANAYFPDQMAMRRKLTLT